MKIGNYDCVNDEKINRAIFGSMGPEGALKGGVGEDASDEAKLAAYDKLGGLIRKGKNNVKTGSFFDFAKKKPHEKANVVFVFKTEGQTVEIKEGEEVPLEVQASQIAQEKKVKAQLEKQADYDAEKAEKEEKKLKRKKAQSVDSDDEE